MSKQEHNLKLSEEQVNFLLNQSGAKNIQEAISSQISLELIKNCLITHVPSLSDKHKGELKQYLIKKFALQEVNNESSTESSPE